MGDLGFELRAGCDTKVHVIKGESNKLEPSAELSAWAGQARSMASPLSEPLRSPQSQPCPLPEGGQPGAAPRSFPPVSGYRDQVTTVVGELHAGNDFWKQSRGAVLAF